MKNEWQGAIRRSFEDGVPYACLHYRDGMVPMTDVVTHAHAFHEVFFFLAGKASFCIEGRSYALRAGDVMIIESNQLHTLEQQEDSGYEWYAVWVEDSMLQGVQEMLGEDFSTCFHDAAARGLSLLRPDGPTTVQLKHLFEKIERLNGKRPFGYRSVIYGTLLEILAMIRHNYYEVTMSFQDSVTQNPKIMALLAYINEHLSENLSLDALAERFFTSKFYMNSQFKRYTGLTIYQYIIKKRLILARNLLLHGVSVTEACMRSGFSDYSNFLKAFKREFGCNPRSFRARM